MFNDQTGMNMSDKELLLPLLALDDRLILPHMAVPVTIDSDEAWAAVIAAEETDGLVLLVPRIDGHFANMGTIAHIEEAGRLPDGREASVLRGLYRGVLNGGAVERAGALWIATEPAPDPDLSELSPRARALGR